MKKSLLLMAMSLAVSSVIAQPPLNEERVTLDKNAETSLGKAPAYNTLEDGDYVSRRSAATNLYYALPEGMTYICWNKEGKGWANSYLVTCPWAEFTFLNKSANPTTNKWLIYSSTSGGYNDLTERADAEGNYTSSLSRGYIMSAPALCNEALTDTFTIGYNGSYWPSKNATAYTRVRIDSITTMAFINDHGEKGKTGPGWGSLSTGYLYGTGTLDGTSKGRGIGVCKAFYQDFPKPMTPLYVEDIFVLLKSVTLNPIPADKVVHMYVIATKKRESDGRIIETTDTIGKLTATLDDFVPYGTEGTSTYSSTGKYQRYQVTFTQKIEDDFGTVIPCPLTIDKPFRVKIVGLDEEGVDFGVSVSSKIDDENIWMSEGVFQVYYPDINETYNHSYNGSTIKFCFTAMFDAVIVYDELTSSSTETVYPNCNVLTVSDDGLESKVLLEGGSYTKGVHVRTAQPWTSMTDYGPETYYYAKDMPEWITSLDVDDSSYESSSVNIINVTCEALPEGVKGRKATLYLEGRGVTSELPIIVVQGDVDDTAIDAIKAAADIKTNAALFNMAGQRVNNSFKGLVIKDGKKFMNK